jgi:ribosomal protein S18 acetylase RimI-like enzyme
LRGLPPRVQVSTAEVDAALADRGWEADFEVAVLAGPVPVGGTTAEVTSAPDDRWMDCWWAVDGRGGEAERDVALRMLDRIEAPTAYASVVRDGCTVAVGRAVLQEQHLGLFAMAVLPEHRRQGLARQVLASLSNWGSAHGAASSYLQVLVDNAPAQALYAAAGFRRTHGYHYRTLP